MKEEEEEEEEHSLNNDILFINNTASYSISEINDNMSNYTGVKSINEETQSTITNNDTISTQNKNNQNKNNQNKNNQNKINQNKNEKNKDNQNENKIKKKKKKEISLSSKKRKSFRDYFMNPKKEEKKEKKEEKDEKDEKDEKKDEKKEEDIKNKINIEKNLQKEVETKFEWDEGGELVYLTGSFCEWKDFYKMTKDDEGIYRISLLLPIGFHQYKFKVDENWEYSKKQPKFEDNGNVNNFIDTTDYNNEKDKSLENKNNEKSGENIKKEKKAKSKSKSKSKRKNESKPKKKLKKRKKKRRLSSIQTINFLNSQNNYISYYPLKAELNKKPLSLPGLYKALFILKEDFNNKKERQFSHIENYYKNNKSNRSSSASSRSDSSSSVTGESSDVSSHSKLSVFGEIIPYVKFQNLYHIHSNHLHSKIIKYDDNTITSMTLRYRYKVSTFIYYKPYNSKDKIRRMKHSKTFKKIKIKRKN